MSTSFSGCLRFCVKLVLCYYCLLSLWRNKYDDDDDDELPEDICLPLNVQESEPVGTEPETELN